MDIYDSTGKWVCTYLGFNTESVLLHDEELNTKGFSSSPRDKIAKGNTFDYPEVKQYNLILDIVLNLYGYLCELVSADIVLGDTSFQVIDKKLSCGTYIVTEVNKSQYYVFAYCEKEREFQCKFIIRSLDTTMRWRSDCIILSVIPV